MGTCFCIGAQVCRVCNPGRVELHQSLERFSAAAKAEREERDRQRAGLFVVRYDVVGLEGIGREIVCSSLDVARETAAAVIAHFAGSVEFEDRTPELYGNRGRVAADYLHYMWRDGYEWRRQLTIMPFAITTDAEAAAGQIIGATYRRNRVTGQRNAEG